MNYQEVEKFVKSKLNNNNNGHGLDHALRVVKNVKLILREVDCQKHICIISAYVHDLIDRKVTNDINHEIQELTSFLKSQIKLTNRECEHILTICSTISYSKNERLTSTEAMVVQDADRLDALGATGIARTIQYSTATHSPIYIEGDKSDDTAIGHFHAKLYKLPDLMNFQVSKQLAAEKIELMKLFETHIISENKHNEEHLH